jgi:hypothetical protein
MTLKEKFEPYVIRYTQDDVVGYLPEEIPILEYQEQCEKIAEEFAIGFAEWCIKKRIDFFDSTEIGETYTIDGFVSKYKINELLEIYKKEKGL